MLLLTASDEHALDQLRKKDGGCQIFSADALPRLSLSDVLDRWPKILRLLSELKFRAKGSLGAFALSAEETLEVERSTKLSRLELMGCLIALDQSLAFASQDVLNVGCVLEGLEGSLYFGGPYAWMGQGAKIDVHSIQSALLIALSHGTREFRTILTRTPACLACRQLLRETTSWRQLHSYVLGPKASIESLAKTVPSSLSDSSIVNHGQKGPWLTEQRREGLNQSIVSDPELLRQAKRAMTQSFAPYSKTFSGIGLKMKVGASFSGCNIECIIPQAGISAIESVLVQILHAGLSVQDVDEIEMVEARGTASSFIATQRVALGLNNIKFRFHGMS